MKTWCCAGIAFVRKGLPSIKMLMAKNCTLSIAFGTTENWSRLSANHLVFLAQSTYQGAHGDAFRQQFS
jgi:hypothetical protein